VTIYVVDGQHILQDIVEKNDLMKRNPHIKNMPLKSMRQQRKTEKLFIFGKGEIPVYPASAVELRRVHQVVLVSVIIVTQLFVLAAHVR
jgi:hypothetical protein